MLHCILLTSWVEADKSALLYHIINVSINVNLFGMTFEIIVFNGAFTAMQNAFAKVRWKMHIAFDRLLRACVLQPLCVK